MVVPLTIPLENGIQRVVYKLDTDWSLPRT